MLELPAALGIDKESTSSLSAFLLKPLQYQNAAILGEVREQRDGRIVFTFRPCPPQSLVSRLLPGQRLGIQECFYALADLGLSFVKIEFVLKKRHPWIGRRASDENVVFVIQVPYPQILG